MPIKGLNEVSGTSAHNALSVCVTGFRQRCSTGRRITIERRPRVSRVHSSQCDDCHSLTERFTRDSLVYWGQFTSVACNLSVILPTPFDTSYTVMFYAPPLFLCCTLFCVGFFGVSAAVATSGVTANYTRSSAIANRSRVSSSRTVTTVNCQGGGSG